MKCLILVIISLSFIIQGCQTGGCVKVGGSYGDYTGDVEYCYDAQKSQKAGGLVLAAHKGQEIFGFTAGEIEKIADKLFAGAVEKSEENAVEKVLQIRKHLEEN